jgi:hypothetical protein
MWKRACDIGIQAIEPAWHRNVSEFACCCALSFVKIYIHTYANLSDKEELMNAVKTVIFHTIGDFNENFVIREEIVCSDLGITFSASKINSFCN